MAAVGTLIGLALPGSQGGLVRSVLHAAALLRSGDMFGLSECPAVFVQCEKGKYHVPGWCWAQAADPESGREIPLGQEGLLRLTVPLTTSYPLLRILTTDRVVMQRGCSCGRAARFLQPRGRVSAARFETCAMKIGKAVG